MAVAFDAVGTTQSTASGTTLSIPITLGTGANRAVVVQLRTEADTVGVVATMGGETLSIITGTDGGVTTTTVMLGKATTLTGAQTVVVSWTNAQLAVTNALSFTGVNQTTPFNGGSFGSGASPFSFTVTSVNGDMTTTIDNVSGTTASTTNQTARWDNGGVLAGAAGDTGPGTGTTTHTWTQGILTQFVSGANVVQEAAASTYGSATADPGRHVTLLSRFP